MRRIFAPGCALMIYKPHLVEKLHSLLNENLGPMDQWLICCKHVPPLPGGMEVINICPGCDRRYRENYQDSSTVSLWEILAETSFFRFPDYHAQEMTILDACPTRNQARIHTAVRNLIGKMGISLVEPRQTKTNSTCCGDIFYGNMPTDRVVEQMKKRADEMPVEDVIVYCVSCSKSMFVGGKRPRYLVDLLFGEETVPQSYQPDRWHQELDQFIASHW